MEVVISDNSNFTQNFDVICHFLHNSSKVINLTLKPDLDSPLFVSDDDGKPIDLTINFDRIIGREVLLKGSFEHSKIKIAKRILESVNCLNFSIIDVGANIGLFTRQMLNSFKEQVNYSYCFEPHPNNFSILKKNFSNLSKIQFNNFGLSEQNIETTFRLEKSNSGNYSLYESAMDGQEFEEIQVILKESDKEISKILENTEDNFVYKSDTQGHDQIIASNIKDEFWSRVKLAIFELWRLPDNEFDEERFEKILSQFHNRRFEQALNENLTPSQIIDYLKGEDKKFTDLFCW